MRALKNLDQSLGRLTGAVIMALAVCGIMMVGVVDYVTGYEVSLSLFYLGPVAVAAWYAGRRGGIAVAVLSCVSWYAADSAAGNQYSNPAIPVWNALVRFGFFLTTSLLLAALRNSLVSQRHMARTDSLTELYSRRAFEGRLEHDLALAQRHKSALTLAYLDVDDFKTVNDARGHAEGDRVLRTLGQVLKHTLRETDTAARIGGDEFALVLPDTDSRGAQEVIAKIHTALEDALAANECGVGCSIGVITFMDAAVTPESAVAAADQLMYKVKRQDKGAIAFTVLGGAGQERAAE